MNKRLKISLLATLVLFIIFKIFQNAYGFNIECTINYLNPWQYSISCLIYSILINLMIFGFLTLIVIFLLRAINKTFL